MADDQQGARHQLVGVGNFFIFGDGTVVGGLPARRLLGSSYSMLVQLIFYSALAVGKEE